MLPLWKVPALAPLIPRQRKALQAVSLIRQTTEELIAKCKEMVDAEEQVTLLLLLGSKLGYRPKDLLSLAQRCLSHLLPLFLLTPCLLFLTLEWSFCPALHPALLPPSPSTSQNKYCFAKFIFKFSFELCQRHQILTS